jgi:hypothetical protein
MIQKLDLVANIEKYYLNGNIESVKWNIVNNRLHVDFVSPHQDLVGHMECNLNLEDGVLGIFNTSSLLKMLSVLDMDILINVEKQHKTPTRLSIEDSNFSLQYSLADPYVITPSPSIDEPEYEIVFPINAEFILQFAKAKNALGSNTKDICRVSPSTHLDGNKQIKFILGEPTSHANKIEFSCDAQYSDIKIVTIPFNSAHIKEILNANKSDIIEANGYVSLKGLLKLEFKTENGISIYYLPELRLG